jgi:hydroxyacylglutathione hydrolase
MSAPAIPRLTPRSGQTFELPRTTPSEVLPGLWAVAGPGLTADQDANGFLLALEGERAVLLDGGCAAGAPRLVENLRWLGYEPAHVVAVLATHCHHDHLSFAAPLGLAPVYLHPAERAWCEAGDASRTCAYLYGADGVPVAVDGELRDGQALRFGDHVVYVLHTPGHSPGGCSFALDLGPGNRVLVTGDTMWGGFHPRLGSDERRWSESLVRIADSGADWLLWGHGTIRPAGDARRVATKALASFGLLMDPWRPPSAPGAYVPAMSDASHAHSSRPAHQAWERPSNIP